MKVLIIEDAVSMALALRDEFVQAGHEVDIIIGVRGFSPFVGIDIDEVDQPPMDVTQYDLALVDGDTFGKANPKGPTIVPQLVASGVPCFGISGDTKMNDEMVAAGAIAGAHKIGVYVALVEGILQADQFLTPPADVAATADSLWERVRNDKDLRRKLDEKFAKYLR